MGKLTTLDIILGFFYVSAAISLIVVAYLLFIKRFKRAKLEAMNSLRLVTSQKNHYHSKTKFLIEAPVPCHVKIDLLDLNEKHIAVIFDDEVVEEERPFDFDPTMFPAGKYYLSLTSDNVKILRGITVLESESNPSNA